MTVAGKLCNIVVVLSSTALCDIIRSQECVPSCTENWPHLWACILSPACYDVMRPHLVVRQHKCPTLYQNTPGDMLATFLLTYIYFLAAKAGK